MDLNRSFEFYGKKKLIPFSLQLSVSTSTHKKDLQPPKGWQKFKYNLKHFNSDNNAIALRTGQTGGIFVLDIDNESQWQSFLQSKSQMEPKTVKARTGSGGIHLYFKWTPEVGKIKSNAKVIQVDGIKQDFDIRNDGGMIIAPPSTYTRLDGSEARYSWINSFETCDLARCPDWLITELSTKSSSKGKKSDTPGCQKELVLGDAEFPIFKSFQDFIFQKCMILPSKLDKLKYFAESGIFNVQTTEKLCIFAQREHSSNHQYLVIQKDGKMVRKCHSKKTECDGKESETWILPEETLKELHSLINLSEPVSKELIELACKDGKEHVMDVFGKNTALSPHIDKTLIGALSKLYCVSCGKTNLQIKLGPGGSQMECKACGALNPKQAMPYDISKYLNLHKYMNVVFNINTNTIVNNNTYYGSEEPEIGWNEFIEDKVVVVPDAKVNEIIVGALSGTHRRLAELLNVLFGENVVHSADIKEPWFIYTDHVWINSDLMSMRKLIMTQEFTKMLVQAKHVYQQSNASNKEKKVTQIQKVITSLENNAMQNAVIEQMGVLCHKRAPEFLDKLDQRRNLLAFTNGVYDLNTGVFRSGRPDDYITMSVGYDYDEEKMKDEDTIQEFNKFFFQVFPDHQVAKYVIKFLGSCLAGYTRDQIFTFGHGGGSNGKGIMINLMAKVLGQFAAKIDASFLCGGMPDPDKPTPTLTRIVGKRFVYISEVVEAGKINEQLFKSLCGEEKMPFRPMYGEQREFMPDFKMFMVCNTLPSFNGSDEAMKRRIRVIPFESKFVEAKEEPVDESRHHYLKDSTLNDKLDSWKCAVMGLLIEGYKLYQREGLSEVPEKMRIYTQRYVTGNNIYEMARDSLLERSETPGVGVPQKDFYEKFKKMWTELYGAMIKIPMKTDVFEKMDVVLTGQKLDSNDRRYGTPQVRGWKGWVFKED